MSIWLALTLTLGAQGALAAPAVASGLEVELLLGGGSVMEWAEPSEIGNGFGGALLIGAGELSVGLALATVLPDARLQGQFGAYWVEGRWAPLGRSGALSPYLALGLGLAAADGVSAEIAHLEPARWVSSGPTPLLVLGGGLRYGAPRGLGVALDLRLYNHTHGGLSVIAGYRF